MPEAAISSASTAPWGRSWGCGLGRGKSRRRPIPSLGHAEGGFKLDDKSTERRLVCRAGNPFGLPAKDRSGRLDMTEPPDLGALLAKINTAAASPRIPATA